jgi:hypothetical protein
VVPPEKTLKEPLPGLGVMPPAYAALLRNWTGLPFRQLDDMVSAPAAQGQSSVEVN